MASGAAGVAGIGGGVACAGRGASPFLAMPSLSTDGNDRAVLAAPGRAAAGEGLVCRLTSACGGAASGVVRRAGCEGAVAPRAAVTRGWVRQAAAAAVAAAAAGAVCAAVLVVPVLAMHKRQRPLPLGAVHLTPHAEHLFMKRRRAATLPGCFLTALCETS